MKSIRRTLKYTNINNISRDMRGYSCTRKWRARDCGADAKHFSRQYVRLNSHGSAAAIIHVAAVPPSPPSPLFPPFSHRSFSAAFLRAVARLIGKDCVSLGWPLRDVASPDVVLALDLSSWRCARSYSARGENSLAAPCHNKSHPVKLRQLA